MDYFPVKENRVNGGKIVVATSFVGQALLALLAKSTVSGAKKAMQ